MASSSSSSKQMLVILAIVAAATTVAGETEFVVGDDMGWRLNFNYTDWAEGKDFRVGDKLVFKYAVGAHDVHKVGGDDFRACSVPLQSQALTSGNDVITLATEGRKWYICGVDKHCSYGMKLVITVQPATAGWEDQAPTPSPSAAPAPSPSYYYRKWLVNY